MIRSITGATFALFAATSVQAMTPAPIPQPEGMITQVAYGCGPGKTRYQGACVPRYSAGVGAPYYAGVVRPPQPQPYYGGGAVQSYYGTPGPSYYTEPHYSPYYHYIADTSGLPWDAVRAYYAGGPWYYGTNGWDDYASRYGIGCTPGSLIKGGDGFMYVCQ